MTRRRARPSFHEWKSAHLAKPACRFPSPVLAAAEIGHKGIDETTGERLLGSALDAGLNVANQEAIEHAIPDAQQKTDGRDRETPHRQCRLEDQP